jgi:Ca2+-binding EF-hand superfamily protein
MPLPRTTIIVIVLALLLFDYPATTTGEAMCPAGFYSSTVSTTTTTTATANRSCTACPKGYKGASYDSVQGTKTCALCLAGQFNSFKGQMHCALCPQETVSNGNRTSCFILPIKSIEAPFTSKKDISIEVLRKYSTNTSITGIRIRFKVTSKPNNIGNSYQVVMSSRADFDDFKSTRLQNTLTTQIHQVDFPLSSKEAKDLLVQPHFFRVRQYDTQTKAGGLWTPSTDGWIVFNACRGRESYLDITHNNPMKWNCCACPLGASCTGDVTRDGNISYVALEGYWRIPNEYYIHYNKFRVVHNNCAQTHEFKKCALANRCLGVRAYDTNGLSLLDVDRYAKETQRVRDQNAEHCNKGSTGILCHTCTEGWHTVGNSCEKCAQDAQGIKTGLFVLGATLTLLCIWYARRRFHAMPNEHKRMRKDLFRIMMIVVNFLQVSTTLPTVFSEVQWSDEYLRFLNPLDHVFNFNVLELTGTPCGVAKTDHSDKLFAMAICLFLLFLFSIACLVRAKIHHKQMDSKRKRDQFKRAEKRETEKIWTRTLEQLFDVVDSDGSGTVSAVELVRLFQHGGKFIDVDHAEKIIHVWSKGRSQKSAYRKATLSKEHFVNALSDEKVRLSHFTKDAQMDILKWTYDVRNMSKALAIVGEIFFVLHSPMSMLAISFYHTDNLGSSGKIILKVDPSIVYEGEQWNIFAPLAFCMLLLFTFGVPLCLTGYLLWHRHHLKSVSTLSQFGWMYDRYSNGLEWWSLHQLLEKLMLTSILIFIESVRIRLAVGVLICLVVLIELNYCLPYRNAVVFWVSQAAHVVLSIKIVATMSQLDSASRNASTSFGHVLIGLDIIAFVLFAIGCCVCVYRYWGNDTQNDTQNLQDTPQIAPKVILAIAAKAALTKKRIKRTTSRSARKIRASYVLSKEKKLDAVQIKKEKASNRLKARVMRRKSMSDNQKRTAVEVIRTQILKAVPSNKLYKTFQRLCKQEKTDGLTKKMFLDLIASVREHLKEEQKMTPIVELAWEAAWAPAETGGELSYEMLYHWLKPSIKRVPTHQEHTSHLDLTTLRESLKACGRDENLAESILLGYDRDHDGGISLIEFQEWLTCTDDNNNNNNTVTQPLLSSSAKSGAGSGKTTKSTLVHPTKQSTVVLDRPGTVQVEKDNEKKAALTRVPTHRDEGNHLTLPELRNSLKAMGRDHNMAEEILKNYDRDHDGGISLTEFSQWLLEDKNKNTALVLKQ